MRLQALGSNVTRVLAIGLPLYVLWNFFRPMPPMQERALFLLFVLLLLFLNRLGLPNRGRFSIACDLVLSASTILAFGHVVLNHEAIGARLGIPTSWDLLFGSLAVLVALEATRRATGWALTILAAVFLLYGFYGHIPPYHWGGHIGFDLESIITFVYLSDNGLFGLATYVVFKVVFLFVMFGKLLEHTGALGFVMDLARALMGRYRGGPAMVSVISSGMVGSITGSAVANVMITGSVTIPLMKRLGFKPAVAGAVEAAASTGGQFMPPIMGAAAFVMMEFLNVHYFDILKAALIPATLYFLGVLMSVYIYSVRSGLRGLPASELPILRSVLWRFSGLVFGAGLSVLVILLVLRLSPVLAVLYAMAVMTVLSLVDKEGLTAKRSVAVLETTSLSFTELGGAVAGVGIIMAMAVLTGMAARFTDFVVVLAGANLSAALVLAMLAAIVLGTGLPTTIAYILLAITIAPALIKMGIMPLAAHFFIFYAGMMAMVTPPVALAAYAGATLAQTSFWRTSLYATLFSLPAYILPFVFAREPALLLLGPPEKILATTLTAALGVSFMAVALVGRLRDRYEAVERTLVFLAAILLIVPGHGTDVVGMALAMGGFWRVAKQWVGRRLAAEKRA